MSRRGPDENGLYDKDHVCRAWLANHEITVEQAHALVPDNLCLFVPDKAELAVRNWLRRFAYEWKTGEPPEVCPGKKVSPRPRESYGTVSTANN